MYEKHFSFKYKPFELVPNPDFLFLSHSHKKAITYLDYGIREKIGFILLTGEIGSGKTTLVRYLIKNLNNTVKLSKINNTKVSSEQLIAMINEDFGLDIKGKGKTILLSELNEFLIEQYAKGFQPVLLIDEAQNLTQDLLEEIRLLSNLETDRTKLLQIILVGQPELKETLMLPDLIQLRHRITIKHHISPLTIEEAGEYIKHRLTIAGNPDVINFKEDMLDIIYQSTRGIPRLINILCDFVLLATYVEGREDVSVNTVREIAKDLESYNYWNESSGTVFNKTLNVEQLKMAGGIIERLIRLEETTSQMIKNTYTDIKSLLEKVTRIEEDFFRTYADQNNNKITDLSERISEIEKVLRITNIKAPYAFEIGEGEPLFEQVERLKRMLTEYRKELRLEENT